MLRILTTYPCFLPVVHVVDPIQAIQQVKIAFEHGADGIFLICHPHSVNNLVTWENLTEVAKLIRILFPLKWIGINYLDLYPFHARKIFPF